jgi:GNAT superfamily N-acetyltransferase
MKAEIRTMRDDDMDAVVELSLLAWAPVFASFERVLGPQIYKRIYPDWQESQAEGVRQVCMDEDKEVWVATVDGHVIGFIAYTLDHDKGHGEVYLLAVHPDYQNHGIGTDLNLFTLEKMRERGMRLAVVGTGGDPGHAPARRTYEKAGYTPLPLMRYYKAL